MIKLPANPNGQWKVTHNSDKLPDLSATKNLTFDKEGYLRLSKPTISLYGEEDDADFEQVVQIVRTQLGGQYVVLTAQKVFLIDMRNSGNYGAITIAEDTSVNTPDNTDHGSFMPDAVVYNEDMVFFNPTDEKLYSKSASSGIFTAIDWDITDSSATLNDNNTSMAPFVNQTTLAVGQDNFVFQFNTSLASSGSTLTLPGDYRVSGVAYNNGYLGVTTHHQASQKAIFAIWDGNTAEANYIMEIPAPCCFAPIGYKDGFAFLDGNGILHYAVGGQKQILAALPAYYDDSTWLLNPSSYNNSFTAINHMVYADGELIFVNLKSAYSNPDENGSYYNPNQPAGIWCYDPAVGIYNRHVQTGVKIVEDTIATTAVDTTDDEITVTAAPETGTPVRYSDGISTAIGGLTNQRVYYTIKVDATTIQLAETHTDALASNAIDLTGTGNNNQALHFYQKRDFGQSFTGRTGNFANDFHGGAIIFEKEKKQGWDLYYQNIFYGTENANTGTTEYTNFGYVLQDTENRGHFITSKMMSFELQEDWIKMFIKHRDLVSDIDKIVVKYRTDNNEPLTLIKEATDGTITWSDSDTFTTTDTQWENVQEGDEVEFIQGTGSGYLAHVTSISESSGTYTVNIDETIKNLTASDTGRAIASRWKKLTTLDNGIISNDDGYSEIAIGVKSKQIQFKVELRGEDIEIEEILVAHELHKPVA